MKQAINLRKYIIVYRRKLILNFLNNHTRFINVAAKALLFTVAIVLIDIIPCPPNEDNPKELNGIRLEILSDLEIKCNGIFTMEVRLINTSQKRFTCESTWDLPFHNVSIHILDADTREPLNYFIIDRANNTNNYVTVSPDEFIGRVFKFKIENGSMTLLNQRSIETLKSLIGEEGYKYDIGDKDFVILGLFRIFARIEVENKNKLKVKEKYIYKSLGVLESNEILVKNQCKSGK